jgi:outer membrane protein insertion porin family
MLLRSFVHLTLALAATGAASGVLHAQALPAPAAASAATFTVGNIRVEGLQRISEGTVFNYLPVNIGDRLDRRRIDEALKAIYATGFFRDVQLRRDGGTLVVFVQERPSIESFDIKGNKDIKTEDLQRSLNNVGLSPGKTFDQSVLDDVNRYMTEQYFSRGKYAVNIDSKVEEVPGNRVRISINIVEGARARIRQINVVGNTTYQDEDLLDAFKLKEPNLLSFYKQDDRYSKESLTGDLETLRSYYMDRGFADFRIDSTQVAIAPEKDDMFVTVNVTEGELYKVSEVKLAGSMVVPEADLKRLIFIKPGETYSRRLITQTTEAMNFRMGLEGYAFSKVEAVPQTDPATHAISLTFLVEPGNRVYVRRINFNGTSSVNDEVFRREMRQLEGGYLSNAAVDRSKERLQRLPFIEKVETKTNPVPGSPDLVDVDFEIKEGLPGQFTAGIGYSESQSLILNGGFTHTNFMGTGNRVAVDINSGRYQKSFQFSHTDPYTTIDGISRTLSLGYRDITQFTSAASDFSTKTISAGLDYAYPFTEYQSVRAGVGFQGADLFAPYGTTESIGWVQSNGKPYTTTYVDGGGNSAQFYGTRFNTFELNLGWGYDSRNRAIFADRGARHRLNVSYAMPGSDVEFWTARLDTLKFVPIWGGFTLMLNGEVNYGQALGDTTSYPPYRLYFAGGPESIRGYRENRLGPKDSQGNPYGGNLKVAAQIEVLLPVPEKLRNSARASLFFDIGNTFATENVPFVGRDRTTPVDYDFSYDTLKQSVGVAVQWLAPLGVFRFSYGIALNANPDSDFLYGDEKEGFQFSVGQAF